MTPDRPHALAFRVSDEENNAIRGLAEKRQESLSVLIRDGVMAYIRQEGGDEA